MLKRNLQDYIEQFRNKKILICGLGRSNMPVVNILTQHDIPVIIYDKNNINNLDNNKNIIYRLGDESVWDEDFDIIVRTPGMNFHDSRITKLRENGAVVTSEIEIFFDLCPCLTIGITGSDGKTTTTSIISDILKNSGYTVHTGGNIGNSILENINNIKSHDIAVLELSSFQLISMAKSPDISVITNISPNHLDVHKDMQEYIEAKKQIFMHQNIFSRTIINFNNNITKDFAQDIKSRYIYFGSKINNISNSSKNIVWVDENNNIIYTENNKNEIIMNTKEIRILGNHNIENYLAAIACVKELVNNDSIIKTAREFSGVKHRLEFVRNINGVNYYNDSIATTPSRTINGALSVFENKKIILIAGGYDKKIPFENLAEEIIKKVSVLILMGDSAPKIYDNIIKNNQYDKNSLSIVNVNNMNEAVLETQKYLKNVKNPEDYVVILSPACASYGLYKNFEERGQDFINIINNIK